MMTPMTKPEAISLARKKPGAGPFTLMQVGPHSLVKAVVRLRTPVLATSYARKAGYMSPSRRS
jgi:hypothetical protein